MDKKISNIKDRVLQIADFKGISKEKFIENLDMTYGNFKGRQKNTSLNSDAIDKILSKHVDINPYWLITGRGEMLNDPYSNDPFSKNPELHSRLGDFVNSSRKVGIFPLAERINMQPEEVAQMIAGRIYPTTDFLYRIIEHYPEINPIWLLEGRGNMYNENSKIKNSKIQKKDYNLSDKNVYSDVYSDVYLSPKNAGADKEDQPHLIPLYDGVVTAGTMSVADMGGMAEPVEYVNAGDWFRDATAAMRVHGDSMHPTYTSGTIVALKEVKNKRLIVFGEDYLIETSEYRVVKRIQRSEQKEYIFACSTNLDTWDAGPLKGRLIHEPFEIYLDDISRLFQVIGSVKKNHSSRIVYNQ